MSITCTAHSLLLPLLLLLLLPPLALTFNLEKMCASRCVYGRGGNLCNCNAFHFAGKRSQADKTSLASALLAGKRSSNADIASSLLALANIQDGELPTSVSDDTDVDFRSRSSRGLSVGVEGAADKGADDRQDEEPEMVVEGFFGVEGGQRSAVQRLAAILKSALGSRTPTSAKSRKWSKSLLPFAADGDVY